MTLLSVMSFCPAGPARMQDLLVPRSNPASKVLPAVLTGRVGAAVVGTDAVEGVVLILSVAAGVLIELMSDGSVARMLAHPWVHQ